MGFSGWRMMERPSRARMNSWRSIPRSLACARSASLIWREELAMSISPLRRLAMPVALPPPVTERRAEESRFANSSARLETSCTSVSEPFIVRFVVFDVPLLHAASKRRGRGRRAKRECMDIEKRKNGVLRLRESTEKTKEILYAIHRTQLCATQYIITILETIDGSPHILLIHPHSSHPFMAFLFMTFLFVSVLLFPFLAYAGDEMEPV